MIERGAFAELHCLSNYSFLRGASHPEELVYKASDLGYSAIAITDECSYSGLVKAHVAAKQCGIKLIVGAEFFVDMTHGEEKNSVENIIMLAPTRQAYGQLSAFISKIRRKNQKGNSYLCYEDCQIGLSDCLILWSPELQDIDIQVSVGHKLKTIFQHFWITLELFQDGFDIDKTAQALTLSSRLNLRLVASNNVHTHVPERQPLQDILTSIRYQCSLEELGHQTFVNAEHTLRTVDSLRAIYPKELLEESVRIAEMCSFSMDELRYEYPEDLVPPHLDASTYLKQLTLSGAQTRWPEGVPDDVLKLIEKELTLIKEMQYEHYFLTVQDIVAFARSEGILCQGRGSAANSAVCYCLFITEVDPARMHLLFERFISKERDEPPDIDVDFEHERREEVIQYIYKRYGRDHAALAATLVTYRPKSAIRDVGKALGFDSEVLGLLAKSIAWWDKKDCLSDRFSQVGINPETEKAKHLSAFVNEILGFPRHLSQHVGGFVISSNPINQIVPIENAAMENRTVIQWDKEDLEALGLLKIDILALGMLTAIKKTLALCANSKDSEIVSIQDIPAEDASTYEMLQRGDSVGVFQVESRAQMAMLPRLKPKCFYDLVIEVAIVRPGPIQGDMVHPYLRRRQGLETPNYPNPEIKHVLERTLGVPIFQEQVIELAMVAAGFSGGEADQLRRAMAAWKKRGGLESFRDKLVNGMKIRGHDEEFAERVFNQIKGFGEYGFPESHAASFALLVYISAWLKCHRTLEFYCGLLNSLPMGFYSVSQIVQDAKRHDVVVLPVDAMSSDWDHSIELLNENEHGKCGLRLGLRIVKGLHKKSADKITSSRDSSITNVFELNLKANLNEEQLGTLARAGALNSFSENRHQAYWEIKALGSTTPIEISSKVSARQDSTKLPPPSRIKNLVNDYQYTGLSLKDHPMKILKKYHPFNGTTLASQLSNCRHGQFVKIAGAITGRQRPSTANGVLFITLEDETGNINVVIWKSVLSRFRSEVLQSQLVSIKGTVEREGLVIHVVAGHIETLDHIFAAAQNIDPIDDNKRGTIRSRDFH